MFWERYWSILRIRPLTQLTYSTSADSVDKPRRTMVLHPPDSYRDSVTSFLRLPYSLNPDFLFSQGFFLPILHDFLPSSYTNREVNPPTYSTSADSVDKPQRIQWINRGGVGGMLVPDSRLSLTPRLQRAGQTVLSPLQLHRHLHKKRRFGREQFLLHFHKNELSRYHHPDKC